MNKSKERPALSFTHKDIKNEPNEAALPRQAQPKKQKVTYLLIYFERFPIKIQKSFRGKKEFSVTPKKKKGGSEQMTVEKSNLASSAYSLWHMSCRRP